jgi:hypothetical protein
MKEIARFQMGSSTFFHSIPGYEPKDLDELIIMDGWLFPTNSMRMVDGERDIFLYRRMSKSQFIDDALTSGVPMRVGKFLVPDFAFYLGMNIGDLRRLQPLIDEIDEKHTYEKIIFDAYIQNDGWWLTEDQRMAAYSEYRRTRNYI